MEKQNYYAILPAEVRYDKELKPIEKLLYAEITALSNKEGYCYASNKYFADIIGVVNETVSRQITKLINKGYVKRKLIYNENSKEIKERRLYPMTNLSIPIDENVNTPIDENVKDNNISVNTIHKEEIYKEEKSDKLKFNLTNQAIDDVKEFAKVINEWCDYKKTRRSMYKTQIGFEKFVKQLIKYSGGEFERAQEIVDISIANNYQGIFPLKGRM